jgi:outer membrane protein
MLRRPLAFALATVLLPAALLPAAAQADDLLQSYNSARNSDPQFAAAESSRAIAAERPVQARATLLPQVNGSIGWNRVGTPGDGRRSGSWDVNASQSIFDYGNYTALRAAKAQDRAASAAEKGPNSIEAFE